MSTSREITRRDALKLGLAGGACLLAGGLDLFAAEEAAAKSDVWVIHGSDKAKLMQRALQLIQENGGFGHAVNKLALKVNAAWARTPSQGANTHPELVESFLKGCRGFGISNVSVPEFPCDSAKEAFTKSGIYEAVGAAGFKITEIGGRSKNFAPTEVPKGKSLQNVAVVDDFLNADAIVNMPVCKSHGGAGLSLGMKNWMGSIQDRGWWHKNQLHQCIADFATIVKPTWTIIDATRVMMDKGPKGPSDNTKTPDLLILSKDQLAADAYAAIEFWGSTGKARYIGIAAEMGLGAASLDKMNVRKLEA